MRTAQTTTHRFCAITHEILIPPNWCDNTRSASAKHACSSTSTRVGNNASAFWEEPEVIHFVHNEHVILGISDDFGIRILIKHVQAQMRPTSQKDASLTQQLAR